MSDGCTIMSFAKTTEGGFSLELISSRQQLKRC